MIEQIVSHDIARLARDKGFNENCRYFWILYSEMYPNNPKYTNSSPELSPITTSTEVHKDDDNGFRGGPNLSHLVHLRINLFLS